MSFVGALLEAQARGVVPALREQTVDLIACLEVVNRHANGDQPSASVNTSERYIDSNVAYAVTVIISKGIEYLLALAGEPAPDRSTLPDPGIEVWRVSCAWEAVLAGDIDSLSEHIELEQWGRDLG